ncbi:RNA methyltransferase [Marinivivus vitaminiproducens]|uniref:RNA methyltransferase n=1 Tax=Marinivivus vitaminiproducens TaxID=3035935 RepID=UPI00279E2412|nr:RNA methyltransferase [Geminicoccaceae bacterium SCSIO 64248]
MQDAPTMRGYFGVGAEGISKPMNLGGLVRTAHAFGASFAFFVDAYYRVRDALSDTSKAEGHLPVYDFKTIDDLLLPRGCKLVGIELIDDSVPMPSFGHPLNAAYVFGPERGSLSPAMIERCDHVVRIPTRFCVNLGVAVAITLYDRTLVHGRYPPRPVRSGGPTEETRKHVHGRPILRTGPDGPDQS